MNAFFKDKTVIVTGGTDGIGRALVDQLLMSGAKVATCGRNNDKLYQLQSQYPSSPLHTMIADVSNENDCRRLVEMTIKLFGGVDILINNAGISMRSEFKDVSLDVIRTVMDINFFGSVYCTKYALESILARKGVIVGVPSIAGYRGLPGRTAYSASKFALRGWLESLRTELLDSGTHVMWVCPGFTTSNIRNAALNREGQSFGETSMEEGKMMSSGKCAEIILEGISRRKREIIMTFTGKRAVFMNKFFPSLADKLTRKFFYNKGELAK